MPYVFEQPSRARVTRIGKHEDLGASVKMAKQLAPASGVRFIHAEPTYTRRTARCDPKRRACAS